MFLIVGLGNPGQAYKDNRHNIGFMAIDFLIDSHKAKNISKLSFEGDLFRSKDILFLKPTTFMNLSGKSINKVKNFFKIENDQMVVIHDELDLSLGMIRVKNGGSSGGHNGIKSMDEYIGNDYDRVRVGIGRPMRKSEVTSHVLGDFEDDQMQCLEKVIKISSEIAKEMESLSIKEINQQYQMKKSQCSEEA